MLFWRYLSVWFVWGLFDMNKINLECEFVTEDFVKLLDSFYKLCSLDYCNSPYNLCINEEGDMARIEIDNGSTSSIGVMMSHSGCLEFVNGLIEHKLYTKKESKKSEILALCKELGFHNVKISSSTIHGPCNPDAIRVNNLRDPLDRLIDMHFINLDAAIEYLEHFIKDDRKEKDIRDRNSKKIEIVKLLKELEINDFVFGYENDKELFSIDFDNTRSTFTYDNALKYLLQIKSEKQEFKIGDEVYYLYPHGHLDFYGYNANEDRIEKGTISIILNTYSLDKEKHPLIYDISDSERDFTMRLFKHQIFKTKKELIDSQIKYWQNIKDKNK